MSSDSDLSNSFAESNQERLKEENKFEQLSQTSEVIEQSVTESTLQDLVKTGVVDMVEMYRASEEKPLAHGSRYTLFVILTLTKLVILCRIL